MKLDKKDRYMIVNQLKILEALYPDEASYYQTNRKAFEEGFESHYEWAMENINNDVLTENESREVIDTLDMYRAIYYYKRDHDISGFNEYALKFKGYDGNDPVEWRMLSYARYFVVEHQRFQEILEEQGNHFDFNSHCEMRLKYKRQLAIWKSLDAGTEPGQRHNLTKEQLTKIVEA